MVDGIHRNCTTKDEKMKIGFVGGGKVGVSLGKMFTEHGAQVTGVMCQHKENAEEAAAFLGCQAFTSVEEVISSSDIIFFTVPDGKIKEVYESVSKNLLKGKVLCHASGSLSASECFYDALEYGAKRGSVHPLYPVSTKYDSYQGLVDAFFVVEGDEEAVLLLKPMLQNMGLKVSEIKPEDKVKYHAGCAIASNLVCGILEESITLLTESGFSRENALEALTPLVRSNIERILSVGPKEALTGPMERGDEETIKKHMKCFSSEEERTLYKAVSKILLKMAKERHSDRDYTKMETILESKED